MAMERTPGRVVFIGSNKELERILEHPFAAWRIFLHPAQRKIAYAPRYAGPAQVTGGAGTGKTVTALHRAAYLARQASEQLSRWRSQPRPFCSRLSPGIWQTPSRRSSIFSSTPTTSAARSRSSTWTGSPTASPDNPAAPAPPSSKQGAGRHLGAPQPPRLACRLPRRSSIVSGSR